MTWIRLSKAILALVVGAWALVVAYGNVADYDTNWVYVQEVMSMRYAQSDPDVAWRAITSPSLHRLAYAAIIIAEAVAGVFFVFAGILMAWRLKAPVSAFQTAKTPFAIGLTIAILVWLFGFMVLAGEWFQMWRSQTYNAQETAFFFYMTMLLGGVYIFQHSDDEYRSADD
ncbi:MAG: DUF2165 domain-containing protein [Pseudomonadota bacterium]